MNPGAAPRCVAVAYSGGRDSTALLHATLAQAAPLGVRVLALHVHHGLSAHADAWLAHCEAQCQRWRRRGADIAFVSQRLDARPSKGDSIEAWARRARYAALRAMALEHGASIVLLAHHRRDQAETLLLQALRGAGVAGLSGMPRAVQRDGVQWLRPWFDTPREAIDAYVRRHRLAHVDDDTNTDARYARNRLRSRVWPALTAAFPHAEGALAAAAQWAQEATAALGELAAIDLAAVSDDTGLRIEAWLQLSTARRSNVLRAWLKRTSGHAAEASLVTRLMNELPACRSARWVSGDSAWCSHRGRLVHQHAVPAATPSLREAVLGIRRAGAHALPGWGGRLRVERVREGGVPFAWLGRVDLLARSGAERFQAGIGRPPRSLKLQFQAAGVPAWERDGPLVYSGGQLVYVPGLGLDARVIGLPGQPLARLHWMRDAALR